MFADMYSGVMASFFLPVIDEILRNIALQMKQTDQVKVRCSFLLVGLYRTDTRTVSGNRVARWLWQVPVAA